MIPEEIASVLKDNKERDLDYTKYLEWERDMRSRLYYPLWVLFLGGFVYSLHTPTSHDSRMVWAVAIFRVLAVLGTYINFLMQDNAISSIGHRMSKKLKQEHSSEAALQQRKAEVCDRIVRLCERALQVIAAVFLLWAVGLSLLVP